MRFTSPSTTRSLLALSLAVLLLVGCDFGAAQQAVDSLGVIVALDPIETTVSGQIVDAATGELVKTPVTLRFRGTNGDAVIDMYSDPLSSQEVAGGVTSFGIRNSRQLHAGDPVRLRVTAAAKGYQPTSETIEIHATGTKQFTLDLLSSNPAQQPTGTSGVRDQSGTAKDGKVESDLTVETPPTSQQGSVGLHLPSESTLHTGTTAAQGQLTVDLSYYPPNDATLDALPGNGTIETNTKTERFGVAGYLNLRIRDGSGNRVSRVTSDEASKDRSGTTVHLPDGAVHPSTGDPLQAGDKLELFRYDADAGAWHSDTTVAVQPLDSAKHHRGKVGPTMPDNPSSVGEDLGFQWQSLEASSTSWWAWGSRSTTTCALEATVQIDPNGQAGSVQIALQRSGLKYTETTSVDALTGTSPSLSSLLGESSVPSHQDYTLSFTTRDGQTRTLDNMNPCNGSYSVTLPEPSSTPRTDALFRAYPECPGNQKVRITSIPTLTIYYRARTAPQGATWQTASDDRITWIFDDPGNPTYIKRAELRLDGLKQDTRYDMYTTYDGERYEASGLVPARDTATVENERVVVNYSQDFSGVCS